jgi:uncharacterized membrane protein
MKRIKYSIVGEKSARKARIAYEDQGMQHIRTLGTPFMSDTNAGSTHKPRGRPVYPALLPFPIACFAGAFTTDLAYWQTLELMWERFSVWLITVGLFMAAFAVIAFAIDLVRGKRSRGGLTLAHAAGYAVVILLSLVNVLVHSRDGYTAVVPTGLMLSGLVVVVLLFTSWVGSIATRRRIGVAL